MSQEIKDQIQKADEPKKTSTMAIVGFILSFVVSLIGMIVSIIALSKLKKTNEGGKGLAIGGIIVGAVATVIGVIVSVVMFITIGLAVDKTMLYNEAIVDTNNMTSSYSKILDLEWTTADFDDTTSLQQAYANDAQTIRTAVIEVGSMIDELKGNKIFEQDPAAKELLDALELKYIDFAATYNQTADVYEDVSQGDYSSASSLNYSELMSNDINTEINALVSYLNTKALEQY